jgi:hypothetical protein
MKKLVLLCLHLYNSRALKGLRALKRECDNVIVFDTSNLSRQEGLQAANFLELHETFLDMCAHNLRSLAVPLTRKGDLLRISLSRFSCLSFILFCVCFCICVFILLKKLSPLVCA